MKNALPHINYITAWIFFIVACFAWMHDDTTHMMQFMAAAATLFLAIIANELISKRKD